MPIPKQLPWITHQRPRHLQNKVHGPVASGRELGQVIADPEEDVIAQQAAASSEPLQGAHGLRIDVRTYLADFFKHLIEASPRNLIVPFDNGCRSIQ